MNTKHIVILAILLSFAVVQKSSSQTCGFGCLGLSGFYAGYTYQFYDTDGLNKFFKDVMLNNFNLNENIKFKGGEGFRIGANIFRARFDKYFITAKGFYQFLKEEESISFKDADANASLKSTLELNHWGIGVDFGIPVFNYLNWKIVEGGITFYKTNLKNNFKTEGEASIQSSFEDPDVNIGYYVGTGFIVHIMQDYISIEGTAVYNQVTIGNLIDNNGDYLFGEDSDRKILDKGNLSATIQLNIGIPL